MSQLQAATSAAPDSFAALFEAVAALVHAQSQIRPVLFVVDDLHWADPATAALLLHVLVTSVRRRGPDLAVLRTVGLVGRQIRATIG